MYVALKWDYLKEGRTLSEGEREDTGLGVNMVKVYNILV